MARVSKRARRTEKSGTEVAQVYSAGIYARLSVEGDERKNESIETQIEIAKQFLEQQKGITLYGCYTDLGKTGTSFARDGFERMMEDVRQHKINCIIVKDLSRFGRNHIETGNYIEKIFPFLGVRFIAVDDHFDSMDSSGAGLSVDLKNLINEMYARDIATKVKSAKRARWEQGSYTGGIPAYGYQAEWSGGKKCLLIEMETADIVREIYQQFVSGISMRQISRQLYEWRIHRPTDYRKTGHVYSQTGESLREWPTCTVKWILTNPIYTGCLVQGMTCGKDYLKKKRHDVASDDWSVREDTHEAVISEDLFVQAAARFEEMSVHCNRDGYSKAILQEENIFEGILFCGECGTGMIRSSSIKEFSSGDKIRRYLYYCPASKRIDGQKCQNKYLSKDKLVELVKAALRQEFSLSKLRPKNLVEKNRQETEKLKTEWKYQMNEIDRKTASIRKRGSELYLRYRMGELTQEEFIREKEEDSMAAAALAQEKERIAHHLRDINAESVRKEHFLRSLMKCDGRTELTRETVKALVHRIDVYPDKRVKVTFAFQRADIIGMRAGEGDAEK